MILFTNNTCDIEKDINAQRKTISVVLGRDMAPNYYHVAILVWIVLIAVLVGLFYPTGMPIVMIMVLAAFPVLRAILNNPLNQKTREGIAACQRNQAAHDKPAYKLSNRHIGYRRFTT